MARIRLHATARADLVGIDEYGAAQFGEEVADIYSRGFRQAFQLLRDHPQAGPPRPELGGDIRCLVHRKHRIFYRLEGDVVLILRVVHHAMDVRQALKGTAG